MKSLFKNCLSVREREGWLLPLRFTEEQMRVYAESEAKAIRSLAPSSVMLAFRSSATRMGFRYRISGKARDWASVDVVCGGALKESVTLDEDEGEVLLTLSSDEGREVHVYLPHLVDIEIRDISSDAPLIPVEEKDKLWLALGDSITQGMVSVGPSASYASLIAEKYGLALLNAGVGGIKFAVEELDHIGREPDIITVALGCNDWGVEREELERNVFAYLDCLVSLYECRNIHLILPIWRGDADEINAQMTFAEHREVIRRVAERYPFINIVDGYELLPKESRYFGDPGDIRVHPNDEGFRIYAEELCRRVDFGGIGQK